MLIYLLSNHVNIVTDSLIYNLIVGPTSVVLGVVAGILWGLLGRYIPEKGDVCINTTFYMNQNMPKITLAYIRLYYVHNISINYNPKYHVVLTE